MRRMNWRNKVLKGENYVVIGDCVEFFSLKGVRQGMGTRTRYFMGVAESWEELKAREPRNKKDPTGMKEVMTIINLDRENGRYGDIAEIEVVREVGVKLFLERVLKTNLLRSAIEQPGKISIPDVQFGCRTYLLTIVEGNGEEVYIATKDFVGCYIE